MPPKPLNIVILAAGAGKRMVSSKPKVLHPLAGRSLLSHVIAAARELSPSRIVIVVGHGADQVKESEAAADIIFAEQNEQLGTGHALRMALPWLDADAPTLVLYGDVPLIRAATLRELLERAGDARYGVLTVSLEDPSGYGRIIRDERGAMLRIVEEKDATAEERAIHEVNTGIVVAPSARLARWLERLKNDNAQGEYYLTDLVQSALADRVEVVSTRAASALETLGVNSRAQLAALERAWQRANARRLLDAGVSLADPERIDVRGELVCGRDVSIDVNCVFEGRVILGDETSVAANCVLRDVEIGPGTRIEAFSHLDSARVGAHAVIGPYARLRPGTELADAVHVGNFVEIKNSRLGQGSKANHLSYLGDAEIGAGVNIGAGTITCNYDGASKHQTVIEDGAFIGSASQLVAPVRVGAGATLAAGTTLFKDAAAGELTLNEKRQISKGPYQRPRKPSR